MERILFGALRCHRIPYTKALRRFVEKRVSAWAKQRFGQDYPKGLTYEVTLERFVGTHVVNASIRVLSKTGSWSGCDWAEGLEQAVIRAVASLTQESGAGTRPAQPWTDAPASVIR